MRKKCLLMIAAGIALATTNVNGKESCANIPASSLNITQPGVYVISVETSNGVTSKKVIIK